MADVLLRHTDDGGEMSCVNGVITTADGLETAAYLSLFGGNEADNGLADGVKQQWWANFEEPVPERRMRSQTQALLAGIPCVPFNLLRIEDAAKADLAWMEKALSATVSVVASIPALDRVQIDIEIRIGQTKYTFDFQADWAVTE